MQDILETVDNWLREGQPVALATVVETWGSSPRQAGAKMGITQRMAMVGSVSAGCVETAVVQEAIDCLAGGRPRLLHYGISDDAAWEVGVTCGGKLTVFVEPLDAGWWKTVAPAVREHHLVAAVTVLDGASAGQKLILDATSGESYLPHALAVEHQAMLIQAAQAALARRQPGRQRLGKQGELDVMIDLIRPEPRLIIVGGAHVSMVLHELARQIGFHVILIDPREAFATAERFPHVDQMFTLYPDKAFAQLSLDSETYIAILTHDPKIDDPALCAALSSPAAYIGVLSGRRSHQQRIERLTQAGVDPRLLEKIHAPIGLNIGAKTPEEIAVAILAEIITVRSGVQDKL